MSALKNTIKKNPGGLIFVEAPMLNLGRAPPAKSSYS